MDLSRSSKNIYFFNLLCVYYDCLINFKKLYMNLEFIKYELLNNIIRSSIHLYKNNNS